jgi:hypothetical protein
MAIVDVNLIIRQFLLDQTNISTAVSTRVYAPPGLPRQRPVQDSISFNISAGENLANAPVEDLIVDIKAWSKKMDSAYSLASTIDGDIHDTHEETVTVGVTPYKIKQCYRITTPQVVQDPELLKIFFAFTMYRMVIG